jgi:hypothetical protein
VLSKPAKPPSKRGAQPDDFKPMPFIGNGVEEIRISISSGAYV